VIDIDEDVSRKITKMALVIFVILFFLSPAQPLLCSTLMGVAAIAPILLGPNALRILGLLAFAVAGYMFWPQYQESKKIPARNEVRLAVLRAEPLRIAVARYVAAQFKLPSEDVPDTKAGDDKADFVILPGGAVQVRLKFAPLDRQTVRLVPVLSSALPQPGSVAPGTLPTRIAVPAAAPAPTPAAPAQAVPPASATPPVETATPPAPPTAAVTTEPTPAATPGAVPAAPLVTAPPVNRPAGPLVLSWTCISDDVAQPYLPAGCRNSENLRRAANMKKQ
jgi:hypothetical protein